MTTNQQSVYDALKQYGPLPDHALVPLVQHVAHSHQSSSGIRTRRRELERAGYVKPAGTVKTASGRDAAMWAVRA